MIGLLPDENLRGHFERMLAHFRSSRWDEVWSELGGRYETFVSLGLADGTPDRVVFARCQELELVLLTANRNHRGPDSLEAAIRDGGPDALPVLTLGDDKRFLYDTAYADEVVADLLEYLTDIRDYPERFRGVGRLYVPKESRTIR